MTTSCCSTCDIYIFNKLLRTCLRHFLSMIYSLHFGVDFSYNLISIWSRHLRLLAGAAPQSTTSTTCTYDYGHDYMWTDYISYLHCLIFSRINLTFSISIIPKTNLSVTLCSYASFSIRGSPISNSNGVHTHTQLLMLVLLGFCWCWS